MDWKSGKPVGEWKQEKEAPRYGGRKIERQGGREEELQGQQWFLGMF